MDKSTLTHVFVQQALVKPCENLHALFSACSWRVDEDEDGTRGPGSMKSRWGARILLFIAAMISVWATLMSA